MPQAVSWQRKILMTSSDIEIRARKSLLVARIVCGVLLLSLFLYVYIGSISVGDHLNNQVADGESSHFKTIASDSLWFFVLLFALAARKNRAVDKHWQKYFLRVITKFVIADAIGVGGLIIAVLYQNMIWSYVATILALGLMVLWWPREKSVLTALQAS